MTSRILFVCLGNICRSPTAEGVLRAIADRDSVALSVDSAGTADYHIGAPPDPRTVAAAARRGYDLSALRARQVVAQDFAAFDFVLAMDRANLRALERLAPVGHRARIGLFLDYAPEQAEREVPDPYYGSTRDFDYVVDLAEAGARGLLAALSRATR
jgi:protein-tyrosine phosphatase